MGPRGRLMLRPSPTTTVATMDSATEDTASDTGPTDTAVTSTARGRLMLRPSPTTTAATMDSATEDTVSDTGPTDTAVTSTAELPDPPASGRDQPRLVTGLSAESGFGSSLSCPVSVTWTCGLGAIATLKTRYFQYTPSP